MGNQIWSKGEKYWWLNEESQQVLNRGYLLKGETVEGAIDRVTSAASKRLHRPEWQPYFKEIIEKGWMSLSSPIWANMGTARGLPISCFNVNLPDSIEGITHKLGEVIMQTKIGGGTSGYFGELRGRGAAITDNGKSSGAVTFMRMFDTAMDVVSQGACYQKGTRVLTDKGFKDFREVVAGVDLIAQVDEYNNISFTDTYELTSKHYKGNLVKIRGKKKDNLVSIGVTPNHRMVIERMKGSSRNHTKRWANSTEIILAKDLKLHRDNRLHIAGKTSVLSNPLTDEERLMIAFQADGRKDWRSSTMQFRFKKQRKIERLRDICGRLNIKYGERHNSNDSSTNFYLYGVEHLKVEDFSWVNISKVSYEWCISFLEELSNWDSCRRTVDSFKYSSTKERNVIKVQEIATLALKRTRLFSERNREGNRKDLFSISISENSKVQGDSCEVYGEFYDDMVYCAVVPKGRLVVSHEGRTLICGNTRRGAFAAYLDIDHPDVKEFLRIKNIGDPIQNLFYGVCVPDYWMQEMINGDTEKREIWAMVLESRQQKGLPYIFFTDNVNRNKPEVYKKLGLSINSSNLCVAPNTNILIKNVGYDHISNYENQFIDIWNGEEWSNVQVVKTGTNQKLVKVKVRIDKSKDLHSSTVSDTEEKELDCTHYHKWYLNNGTEIRTKDLKVGDKLLPCKLPNGEYCNYQVISIEELPELSDTYCFTEHKRNMGMFNGILTGQCSEIALPSTMEESFVCCLSSMNLELYDEWKDTDAVEYAVYFLDAVMSEFIDKTHDNHYLKSAHNFAKRHRALGLGVLGWHSYLQKNMIPFESLEAKMRTNIIFKQIQEQSKKASKKLADIYGAAPIFLEGESHEEYYRNTTTMAIAPTTSSSAILGQVSPGIEPFSSNYYKAGLAKGNFIRKNKYLKQYLESVGLDTEDTWRSIMLQGGSIQHLEGIPEDVKKVFKTFKEIPQKDIIIQASMRQKYIDQAQSLNINIPPEIPIKEVNGLIIEAWKLGLKTLYYQRSHSVSKELLTNIVSCSSCES